MKKNIEITGILKIDSEKEIVVDLFSNGVKLDWFEFNPKHKSINVELSKCMGKILKVDVNDYFDYIKLLDELGLEIPKSYRRHWTPKTGQKHYYIDFEGDICSNGISSNFGYNEVDRRRCENFNMFPTRELAEKTINVSKLGRLVLLWQYANDCLFTPDWRDREQCKYYIAYNYKYNEIRTDIDFSARQDKTYFQTREQAKAFVDMYSEEIKKIMGIE